MRLCWVLLVCADVYLQIYCSSIGCIPIYAAILLPTCVSSICMPGSVSTRGSSPQPAQPALSTPGRGHDTLTQAKAIAADTSRSLLRRRLAPTGHCPPTSVDSVPSHTLQQHTPITCQHRSARPIPMPSPLNTHPNTHSDPPASLRGCSQCTDGGVAEMAGRAAE